MHQQMQRLKDAAMHHNEMLDDASCVDDAGSSRCKNVYTCKLTICFAAQVWQCLAFDQVEDQQHQHHRGGANVSAKNVDQLLRLATCKAVNIRLLDLRLRYLHCAFKAASPLQRGAAVSQWRHQDLALALPHLSGCWSRCLRLCWKAGWGPPVLRAGRWAAPFCCACNTVAAAFLGPTLPALAGDCGAHACVTAVLTPATAPACPRQAWGACMAVNDHKRPEVAAHGHAGLR